MTRPRLVVAICIALYTPTLGESCPSFVTVHAGLHKTGTSYIQQTLKLNQDLLLAHELLYPRTQWAAHHFLFSTRNTDPTQRSTDAMHLQRASLWQQVANESCHLKHGALISTEQLSIRPVAELQEFASHLRPRRMRAILFYRNLKSYTLSMYTRALKPELRCQQPCT